MSSNEICNQILEIRKKYYHENKKWIKGKTIKDLRNEYEKKIGYFISFKELNDFDFSNDCFNEEYMNIVDAIDKYVLYKCKTMKKGYQFGEKYKKDNMSKYQTLVDPDSKSILLQLFYKRLYKNYYKDASFVNNIQGETMNSIQLVLNSYIGQEIKKQEIDCKSMQIQKNQKISFAYFLEMLCQDENRQEKATINALSRVNAQSLMKVYHTLGNFIIVPKGCNTPRGICILKDFWDLTLACIYNWYARKENKQDRILKKLHNADIEYNIGMIFTKESDLNRYAEWLEKFKIWDKFVEENYLGDEKGLINFVEKIDEHYGRPRELWTGHFEGNIMPTTIEEYRTFFANSSNFIKNRGSIMKSVLEAEQIN